MAKRGRPTKLTPEITVAICGLIEQGNYRDVAAKACGITYRTMHQWLLKGKDHPTGEYGQFRQAVMAAENKAETGAIKKIILAGDKDAKLLIWWLERKFPLRWGRDRSLILELERRLAELEKQRPPAQAATSRAGSGGGASDG